MLMTHRMLSVIGLFSVAAIATTSIAGDTRDELISRLSAGTPATTPLNQLTSLEQYIRRDDGAFKWTIEKTVRVEGETPGTWNALRMTSQVWRTTAEVDIPEWTHWVCVWIPDRLVSDKPILMIGGGRRKPEAPAEPPNELKLFASAGAIVVSIDNVPNQPMHLGGDPTDRSEDGLVARTWTRAMETGDPTWIARFPMVKSAAKAMDTAEQFIAAHPPIQSTLNGAPVDAHFRLGQFLVAGGSKRGWTTWLTAAVDRRVGALVPFVIDVLDLPAQMRHHHGAYGFWSEALNDYVETGLTDRFQPADHSTDPLLQAVLAHDDPINWLSRVGDRPKLLINASGDEFFLPDSSAMYEDRLPQPWRLRYEPNSGHNLKNTPAAADLIAFYRSWVADRPLPDLTWNSAASEGGLALEIRTTQQPAHARVWHAQTEKERDFRMNTIGKAWTSDDIAPVAGDPQRFRIVLPTPASGFRAAFVELTYPPIAPGVPPVTLTTRVFVLPDVLPHEAK